MFLVRNGHDRTDDSNYSFGVNSMWRVATIVDPIAEETEGKHHDFHTVPYGK